MRKLLFVVALSALTPRRVLADVQYDAGQLYGNVNVSLARMNSYSITPTDNGKITWDVTSHDQSHTGTLQVGTRQTAIFFSDVFANAGFGYDSTGGTKFACIYPTWFVDAWREQHPTETGGPQQWCVGFTPSSPNLAAAAVYNIGTTQEEYVGHVEVSLYEESFDDVCGSYKLSDPGANCDLWGNAQSIDGSADTHSGSTLVRYTPTLGSLAKQLVIASGQMSGRGGPSPASATITETAGHLTIVAGDPIYGGFGITANPSEPTGVVGGMACPGIGDQSSPAGVLSVAINAFDCVSGVADVEVFARAGWSLRFAGSGGICADVSA